MREQGAPDREIAKLRAEALDRLIEARLIEGIVANLELYAKEEEIDATIESIASENGLSLEQLYASVLFHGMAKADYRNQIKQDLERRNVVQGIVGGDIEIEESAIQALYDERFGSMPERSEMVRIRQILVSFGGPSKHSAKEACDIARQARERALAGEDFEVLARELSEVAPNEGGDIGWLHMDKAAAWMSKALESLQDGQTSDVVLLPFGCCILNLVESRDFTPVSYENARVALHRELYEQELEKGYREWMENLRDQTYIDRRGYFAEAARFGESTFQLDAPDRERVIP